MRGETREVEGMGWKTEVQDKDKLPGGQLDLFDLV